MHVCLYSIVSLLAGAEIAVVAPEDMRARFIIDSVATYVMVDGCPFEQALMSREANNPEFMFLFDLGCPEHAYYRWRLYSLAQVSPPPMRISRLSVHCFCIAFFPPQQAKKAYCIGLVQKIHRFFCMLRGI